MINVNQLFIDSCNSDYIQSQIKIKVSTTKSGTVLATLNDDEFNISSNSIDKQASSGSSCNIGGVCSNKIKIVLNQKGIEKLNTVNGFKKNYVLHLIQWNKVDDNNQSDEDFSENLDHSENTTGKCDLGFYYISEIKNNYYDCEITAYDGMIAFRKNLTIDQLKYMQNNSKTVDQWLTYFCTLVNDTNFNISYIDNAEVTCNNSVEFKLSDDSSFDTIREVISQLAQLKMAYATINTDGNLTLNKAIKTSATYDDEIDNKYMFNCDNEVTESVISYFYTSIAGFGYSSNYTDLLSRNHINLFLEENKFLRGFEPYNGSALSSNTLSCLQNMANAVMGISFYSCDCNINNRPYIELSDNIRVERKLVDQQGTVTIMSIPCIIDSVSHEVGMSTHLTSNSTVSNNSDSTGKTSVNSQPKDPSNADILDMFDSPVIEYSEDTASVRIRLDDEKSEHFNKVTYKNNYADGDTSYTLYHNTSEDTYAYILTDVGSFKEGVIYERETPEKISGKYIYNSNIVPSDILNLKEHYLVNLKIKGLDSLINKQVLYSLGDITNQIVTATITGVYFYRRSNFTAEYETPLSSLVEKSTHGHGFSSAVRDIIYNELFTTDYNYYDLTSNIDYTGHYEINNAIDYNFYVRSDTETAAENAVKYINPYIDNYDDIVKSFVFLWDIVFYGSVGDGARASYIALKVEYNYENQHYSTYISLARLLGMIGFTEGLERYWTPSLSPLSYDESYQFIANYVNNNNLANNYLDILNTIYNGIDINVYDCFLDATYLTAHSPLSDSDKEKVKLGIVTQNDLEELREQIRENSADESALNGYVNEVNSDLQSSKGDITQNANDISSLNTRVSTVEGEIVDIDDDINDLDTRLQAIEQGQGSGEVTRAEFTALNNRVTYLENQSITATTLKRTTKPLDSEGHNYDIAIIYEVINNVKIATELYNKVYLWFKLAEFKGHQDSAYSDIQNFNYSIIFDDVVAYANFTHGTGNSGQGLWAQGTISLFATYTEGGQEVQLTEGTDYTLTWTQTGQSNNKFLLEFNPNVYIYSLRINLYGCYRCSVSCDYLINNPELYSVLNS